MSPTLSENFLLIVSLLFLHFLVLCSTQLQCSSHMSIDAAVKIGNNVHVFHNNYVSIINSLMKRKDDALDRPVFREDSLKPLEDVWKSIKPPVDGVYLSSGSTINLIKFEDNNNHLYQYNSDLTFKSKVLLSSVFPFTDENKPGSRLRFYEVYSSISKKGSDVVLFLAKIYKCQSFQCAYYLALFQANSRTGVELPARQLITTFKPPTALLDLEDWSKGSKVIAFFGPFFVVMPYEGLKDLKTLSPKTNYQLNTHWFGCPQDFCFEGTIDALFSHPSEGTTSVMFRGIYYWMLVDFNFRGSPARISKDFSFLSGSVDASVSIGKSTYFFKDDTLFIMTGNKAINEPIVKVFGSGLEKDIDAAFATSSEIFLFKDFWFWVFDIITLKPKEARIPLTRMKGLPKNLDAALTLAPNKYYIFKANFVYRFDHQLLNSRGPFASESSHEVLLKCPAAYYASGGALADYLDINSRADFLKYVKKSRPKALTEAEIPATTPTISTPSHRRTTLKTTVHTTKPIEPTATTEVTGPVSSTRKPVPSSDLSKVDPTKNWTYIIIVVIILGILLLVSITVFVVVASSKKRKTKETKEAKEPEVTDTRVGSKVGLRSSGPSQKQSFAPKKSLAKVDSLEKVTPVSPDDQLSKMF